MGHPSSEKAETLTGRSCRRHERPRHVVLVGRDADAAPALNVMLGNKEEAWAALRMIRETLEELGSVREPSGPTMLDEAGVLIEAITGNR